ncbi:MAG: transposase, partial [Firmicutes bacterium]|nr:transposase [Bacillota bacterium]
MVEIGHNPASTSPQSMRRLRAAQARGAPSVTILYASDLGTLNHKTRHRRSRRTHQEVGALEVGHCQQYLEYKLQRHGIPLVTISETHTSQTCPHCGHLNTVAGRFIRGRACNDLAHRDGVGAVNILKKGMRQGDIPWCPNRS